jgi:hypothetical protein
LEEIYGIANTPELLSGTSGNHYDRFFSFYINVDKESNIPSTSEEYEIYGDGEAPHMTEYFMEKGIWKIDIN